MCCCVQFSITLHFKQNSRKMRFFIGPFFRKSINGKGAYFASSADIAHGFSILGAHEPENTTHKLDAPQGVYTMLLCRLVTGKRQLGTEHMVKPDANHDSARNGSGTYMVIFESDCILPIAIIEYTIDRN